LKVKAALLKAKNSDDPYLKKMTAAMLEKFDKYWEEKNNVMVISSILVVWTSLGPLPRWVPGLTTRWAPGTTRLVPHDT
jgi:hypothetical protein